MIKEKSCGAVVFTRVNNKIKYLLIRSLTGTYGFPKGHVEAGETEEQTALREVFEEVGVKIDLLRGFRTVVEYSLPRKEKCLKQVVYFLGEYSNQRFTHQKTELSEALLVDYETAIKLFQFDNNKRILTEANDFLLGKKPKKNIIHIFGASGSGTTTLGRKICEELGYTHIDSDDYYWMPTEQKFTVKRSPSERVKLMQADIDKAENVVISGSLVGWGDELTSQFTLAVRIVLEQSIRIERLKQREMERYGSRIDVGGDRYNKYIEFVEWAKQYDTGGLDIRSKAKHDEWQKMLSCDILYLDGADSVEENFEKVKKALLK